MKYSFYKHKRTNRFFIYLFYCALFLATFSGGTFLIRILFPRPDIPPDIPVVSAKLRHFARHKDNYNTLFLGSSRTYRHVMPDLFDRSMAKEGYEINSFNLGIPALQLPEAHFYLNKILAMEPTKLEWVFVEYLDGFTVRTENLSTTREIYWHRTKFTFFVTQAIFVSDYNLLLKLQVIYSHFIPTLYHMTNVGEASRIIQEFLLGDHREKLIDPISPLGPLEDGFLSLEEEHKTQDYYQNRHQNFLDNIQSYKDKVNSLETQTVPLETTKPHKALVLEEMVESIEAIGATPLFLLAPSLDKQPDLIRAHSEGYVPTLFLFNDPTKFPNLYDESRRFDRDHLNDEGSREYTKLLAQRFVEYLAQNGVK